VKIKIKLISFLIIVCILPTLFFGFKLNSEDLFNKIREHYTKNYPNDFVATVTGTKINKDLQNPDIIPKSAYCNGKKPMVKYLFLKGEDESIIIENVENPYVTRFQAHIEIYRNAKSFFESKKTFSEFQKTYYWEYISSLSSNYFVVKMRKHRVIETDYILLHFDKRNLSLKKAIQYSNNKPSGTFVLRYKKVKKYLLPSELMFTSHDAKSHKQFKLIISNYQVNVGLTPNILVQLQDDCPSLSKYLSKSN